MKIERDDDLAILRMTAGKANALSPEMLEQLAALVGEFETSNARALVVTGDGRSFCAGLALPQLMPLDRPAMRVFMGRFRDVMLRIFALPVPVVAAIDGHAIAGGCVLACQCDVRLMTDDPKPKIGLNEVQIGLGLPALVIESLRLILPPASVRPVALGGRLLSSSEAASLGLVDELVAAPDLLARARTHARELASVSAPAFAQVKLAWRRPAIEAIERSDAELAERWLDTWFAPDTRLRLQAIVDRLGR